MTSKGPYVYLESAVQEASTKLLAPTTRVQACGIFSSQLSPSSSTFELGSDPEFPKFTRALAPSVAPTPNHPRLLESHRRHPLVGKPCRCSLPQLSSDLLPGYQSKIGENHFLTKELRRSIEELQRRRRLLWTSQ